MIDTKPEQPDRLVLTVKCVGASGQSRGCSHPSTRAGTTAHLLVRAAGWCPRRRNLGRPSELLAMLVRGPGQSPGLPDTLCFRGRK